MITVTRVFDVWHGDKLYITNPYTGKNEIFTVCQYACNKDFGVKNETGVYLEFDGIYSGVWGKEEDLRWRVLVGGEHKYMAVQLLKVVGIEGF